MRTVRDSEGVRECAEALGAGAVVAYPTETFYGLGVDAQNETALKRLIEFKGRTEDRPFPILISSASLLGTYAEEIPQKALELTKRFWPGPLTLILRSGRFPAVLQNPRGGVGFRVSAHPLACALVSAFGGPITTTSANRSGQPAAVSAAEVVRDFLKIDLLVLEGGTTPGGKPSTVVDFTSPHGPTVVRAGAISTAVLGL